MWNEKEVSARHSAKPAAQIIAPRRSSSAHLHRPWRASFQSLRVKLGTKSALTHPRHHHAIGEVQCWRNLSARLHLALAMTRNYSPYDPHMRDLGAHPGSVASPPPPLVLRSMLLRLGRMPHQARASEVAQVVGRKAVSHHPALSPLRP